MVSRPSPAALRSCVWVVVLGDLGRSPRMQYHALSLADQAEAEVQILAQGGSKPLEELSGHQHISIHTIKDAPRWLARWPSLLRLPIKLILQAFSLLWMMFVAMPPPEAILLQVPPALPTLPLCCAAAAWHACPLVVDWHNFAYTLMALSLGPRHFAVRLAEQQERFWGRRAACSLCVTRAMAQHLACSWGIQATVFHDRAPAHFQRLGVADAHSLLLRLGPELARQMQPQDFCSEQMGMLGPDRTLFTGREQGLVRWLPGRPALLVSSTSWTLDEDFGILLEALQLYDFQALRQPRQLPPIVLCVTGKGPLKQHYQGRMAESGLQRVACRTLWLEAGDYPRLLGAADLGVCLHTSSSGLDLPMKVVDMFGCSLPVCAAQYGCIGELVEEQRNGLIFKGAQQLAQQLMMLLQGFPDDQGHLHQMRTSLQQQPFPRWQQAWAQHAMPAFKDLPICRSMAAR